MKRTAARVLLFVLLISILPLSVLWAAFGLPPQFEETYYGELAPMYRRLEAAQGKKLVVIGGSAVAFGLRADLLEAEFPGYTVIPFGLYGAIGTKAMLELSRVNLGEGDLVLVLPEQNAQTLSTYFSARELWMAAESCPRMAVWLDSRDRQAMAASLIELAAEKYAVYTSGRSPQVSGVYSHGSFLTADGEEAGHMTWPRPYNIMAAGFDPTAPVSFAPELLSPEFADYLNGYVHEAADRGAQVLFGFAPVNALAVEEGADVEGYYRHLAGTGDSPGVLDCPVLGHPQSYILEHEWFYDNNVHMNSAGALVYTRQLAEDLKAFLGDPSVNSVPVPEKPIPPLQAAGGGENADQDCFTYAITDAGAVVTGLTEEGRGRSQLVLPASWQGRPVVSFTAEVFAGNTALTRLTLPQQIGWIPDNAFSGCTRLTALVLEHTAPETCAVGAALLSGADACRIYVPETAAASFTGGCTGWSSYAHRITGY